MGGLTGSEIRIMSVPSRKFSKEFKDELVREVIDTSKPIVDVAKAYGVGAETLRRWVIKYRESHGETEVELSVPDRARLKGLERENQDLRAEMAFLKKAASYFARESR
jgi:transposase